MPIRVIVQGVEQVSLLVDNEHKYVRGGKGVLIYVAFLRDGEATDWSDEVIQRAVDAIVQTRIFTHLLAEARSVALSSCPEADIVIVPQASLGGKIKKGHTIQFHQLVDKDSGAELFARFCACVRATRGVDAATVDANGATTEEPSDGPVVAKGRVLSGTYGNRQGLRMESCGPFTHTFDL